MIVYANKGDLGGNLSETIEQLRLNEITDREWFC